ncbi:AraC family transcriptional regulator ligand-binding domain-containing protein [Streptacidiphilus sp. EB103A]|uniref:AraC family transcriptional regulator ligand-binding domain-containing protein n=1 Tax=Streptacidiphilus sp. EB103A TaxID=3156275 RepID=UPI00351831E7
MYIVAVPKMVLSRTAQSSHDIRRLARDAGIPEWATADDDISVGGECYLRALELAAHHRGEPDIGLLAGAGFVHGQLGVYDYLFSSARTLGEGHAANQRHLDAITTAGRFLQARDSERDLRIALSMDGDDQRLELAIQVGIADVLTRSRWATGQWIRPVEVTLRQRAPRRSAVFTEFLGTTRVVFDADTDSLVLREVDLSLPLRTADPALAAIMRRHVTLMPRVQPQPTTWPDRVQQALAAALADGTASLDTVARRLATSSRTLQRRLAEAGTTWRHELDRARRAELSRHAATHRERQAALVGYSDARALRRAQRRWDAAV